MSVLNKKIVVCTPAGRHQYMRVLAPRLLSDTDVDRWDIWLNTDNQSDIDYIYELSGNPKVRVVKLDIPICHPVAYRIHHFFSHATDTDTVYVRLDDDIVYYHPGSIKKLAEYRIKHPEPFLVYGNVINTAITSYEHQRLGRIPYSRGTVGRMCMDEVGWGSSEFAKALHNDFIGNPSPDSWELPDIELGPPDYLRQSINVISWLGEDCSRWVKDIQFDEEAWLAHQRPKFENRPNVIAGSCGPFVHYAFYSQRANGLDDTNILNSYSMLTPSLSNRLETTLEKINSSSYIQLKNPHYLSNLLASAGLYNDGRPMYGEWEFAKAPLKRPGLWQHPEELAHFLIWLYGYHYAIEATRFRVLEIGCFHGYLSAILHTYLNKFFNNITYTAIDLYKYEPPIQLPGLEYRYGVTSNNFNGKDFDLVIIDADHNYNAASVDYERLKYSSLVMFHDIRDACVKREAQNGGIPTLYHQLKKTRPAVEFIRSDWEPWMGIGVFYD